MELYILYGCLSPWGPTQRCHFRQEFVLPSSFLLPVSTSRGHLRPHPRRYKDVVASKQEREVGVGVLEGSCHRVRYHLGAQLAIVLSLCAVTTL